MSIIPERLAALDTIQLDKGGHGNFENGHCAMEVVSWLAGEGFTDAPDCASRVLRTFTISLNDTWQQQDRQRLVPLLPQMVGTGDDGLDVTRSYMALDWLIRSYTPAWLDLAGLKAEAQALRDLRRIVDMVSAEAAGPVVRAGRKSADAAWAAARDAAWDAAWAAAGDAAWDAAGAAAWDAAWDAAGDAAWDAAGAAARDAARDAAWAAAWDAAWDAAGAAAGDAAGAAAGDAAWAAAGAAAGAAAWAAAGDALAPTVASLKTSALELLANMIHPEGN